MSKKFGYKNHNQQDNYVPPYDAAILAEPITNAGFSEEVLAKLINGKINLFMDIAKRTEKDMYKINTFNKKNLFEVKRVLQNKRLGFKPEPVKDAPPTKSTQDKKEGINNQNGERTERAPRNNTQPARDAREFKDRGTKVSRQNRGIQPQNDRRGVTEGQKINPDRNRNKPLPKQDSREDNKVNLKQQNKRIWDADGISEQVMKDEHEKRRPSKPVINTPRDIYVKINKNDKWGFANRNGKEVVQPIYDEVFVYKEDLCCVEKDDLFGFIDREGNEVIPIEYDCALSFSEGYACVYKNNKCGYINKNNEIIIDLKYDAGTPVLEGNCRVKKDGKWGELHLDNPGEIRWIN